MKQEHPIARFVGTIITHLILAAAAITVITIPVLLILAVLTFWKTLRLSGVDWQRLAAEE